MGTTGTILKSTDAGDTWSLSAPTSSTLGGLYFLDDNNGWVVGGGGLVLHTTNGGTSYSSSNPTGASLNSVFFLNSSTGVAVGNAGTIIRTTNTGSSWTTQTPTSAILNSVFFVGATGWIVGGGIVLKSTDSGANWTSTFPTGAVLNDVYFVNSTTGWAVGTTGTILKSTNGGTSWTSTNPVSVTLYSVQFLDTNTGWAVGGSGTILKTTNGGTSWTQQHPVSGDLKSVFFINSTTGWAVGLGGVVLKTTDAGANWSLVPSGTSAALNGVQFTSIPTNVSVTVQTSPSGRSFSVDGTSYTTAQTFTWLSGSAHTIATTSPQSGASGTQYVFASWSDGGAASHAVAPTTGTTYTASFTTQYNLTMNAGTGGTVSPASGYRNAGSLVSISASASAGYQFAGWSGSGSGSYSGAANPASVTMNGPVTETASFTPLVSATVGTSPVGRSFTVDGTPYASTQSFSWPSGSSHVIAVSSPQAGASGTQYVFTSWSDGGAASHAVAPTGAATYTATFTTQYYLTMGGNSGGTIAPASGWRAQGASVPIEAHPSPGGSFIGWSGSGAGSYSGPDTLSAVTMNGPVAEDASFACCADAHTLLLLHFDGTTTGAAGETPSVSDGISFESGVSGSGAYFASANQLVYPAAGNLDPTSGTLEFWIKPRWNGNDALDHFVLRLGLAGGILIGKDAGNYWRSTFNRFGPSGPELGTGHFITNEWLANQWHHSAFTWNASSLKLYIDGQLVATAVPPIPPPAVSDPNLQLGADGASAGLDAVLDELRISDVERSAQEIGASFLNGLTVTSLAASPDTADVMVTWPIRTALVATTSLGTLDIPMEQAAWASSDTNVVQVLSGGRLVAKGAGQATLTATVRGVSGQLLATVHAPVLPPVHEAIAPFMATPVAGHLHEVPVLVIRYLASADGVNLDTSISPDFYDLNPITLDALRARIASFDERVKFVLEQGSRFRAYRDPQAIPSLGYRVVDDITVFEQTPPGKVLGTGAGYPIYAPDWFSIFDRLNVAHYVNDLGVREIWFWQSGFDPSFPSYNPAIMKPADFRVSPESNMSSPVTGDVSNSFRDNTDLPVYAHTYTVYGSNFRRTQAEAIHNHGHQIEAQLSYVNQLRDGNMDLWWKQFVGQNASGQFVTGRCGWTHMPPNTTSDYDYLNPTLVSSDIEDWKPDHSGATTLVNVNTWGDKVYAWPDGLADFPQRQETQWYLYWMQSIPGHANAIPFGTDQLTDWWDFFGAWDTSIPSGEGLHVPVLAAPGDRPKPGARLEIRAATPNPFASRLNLTFALADEASVKVDIYDLHGRRVKALFAGKVGAGEHVLGWTGDSDREVRVDPGIYFVRVRGAGVSVSRRVVML